MTIRPLIGTSAQRTSTAGQEGGMAQGGPEGGRALAELVSYLDPRLAQLEQLRTRTRMWDAVIDEVDGRRIRIGDDWLVDWASCNYLGLDIDPYVIAMVTDQVARWGTHPGWSRMLGSP